MTRFIRIVLILSFGFYLSGCAIILTDYKTPIVSITSFKAIPGKEIIPRFEIKLHIINPNRSALDLKGICYTVNLEGHKFITGASNKLPRIEAYGEGDVLLDASIDLFHNIRFLIDLAKHQKKSFTYSLEANLDLGIFYPVITISKKGKISLFHSPPN
ncbi:MAG: LEA type 2 family protein [Desulfobacteraceae bacterium]|nr:LEA type 2 family protein [Desulfobacteraceae bacterium]